MITRGFMDIEKKETDPSWFHCPVSEMKTFMNPLEDNLIDEQTSCADALKIMKQKSIDCLLMVNNG